MHDPLIDRELLSILRLVHGGFNITVGLLFLYHGTLGFRIRRERQAGRPLPFVFVKRHRRSGPIFAVLGVSGFLFGLVLALLDRGLVLRYPAHFFTGCLIVLFILAAVAVSRRIKGPASPYRTPHLGIGSALLAFYLLNFFLGFGVLF